MKDLDRSYRGPSLTESIYIIVFFHLETSRSIWYTRDRISKSTRTFYTMVYRARVADLSLVNWGNFGILHCESIRFFHLQNYFFWCKYFADLLYFWKREVFKNNKKNYDNRAYVTSFFKISKITNLKIDCGLITNWLPSYLSNLQYEKKTPNLKY